MQARKRRRRLFVIAVVIVIVTILAWLGLVAYEQRLKGQQATIDEQIRAVELEIAKIEPNANRITRFEDRLEALDGLLNQHVSWNKVLQDVERLLPPTTTLGLFIADGNKGTISVEATTENIDQVAVTLATLLNTDNHETIFTAGTLNSVKRQVVNSTDEESPEKVEYSFGAELRFDPSIIRNNPK